jgi:hypothetical protein
MPVIRSRFASPFKFLIVVTFLTLTLVSTAFCDKPGVISFPPDMPAQVSEFAKTMSSQMEFHTGEGSDYLARWWMALVQGGLDLNPMREFIHNKNNGGPEEFLIYVNPKSVGYVTFVNRFLKDAGLVDMFRARAVLDDRVPEKSVPLEKDKESWEQWVRARSRIIPNLGIPAVLAQVFVMATGHNPHPEYSQVAALAAITFLGSVKWILEWQFSAFSGRVWSKIFSSPESVLEKDRAITPEEVAAREFLKREDLEIGKVQSGVRKLYTMIAPFVKNFGVNWLYTDLLVKGVDAGISVSRFFGAIVPPQTFDLLGGKWLVTKMMTPFYLVFGLPQISTSKLAQNGQISEFMRQQMESAGIFVNAPLRLVQAIPPMAVPANWVSPDLVGSFLQLAIGVVPGLAIVLKEQSTPSFAKAVKYQAELNAGLNPEPLSSRERKLAAIFAAMPLNRQQTLPEHLETWMPKVYNRFTSTRDNFPRVVQVCSTAMTWISAEKLQLRPSFLRSKR